MAEPPGPSSHYPIRESLQVIDPDTQCSVPIRSESLSAFENPRCIHRLSCRVHSVQQKERVGDRSLPFAQLLEREASGHVPDTTSRNTTDRRRALVSTAARAVDLDAQCCVPDNNGLPCTRVITCDIHTIPEKERVQGRTACVTNLFSTYKLNRSSDKTLGGRLHPSIHCHVDLPQAGYCPGRLNCPLHTLSQKTKVKRVLDFKVLLQLQTKYTFSTDLPRLEGFGLASAAAPSDADFGGLHRLYRRDGMQTAATEVHARGEAGDIDFVICNPAGRDLENLRSVLYHTVATRPSRNLTAFLPQENRITLPAYCSQVLDEAGSYHFCFVNRPHFMRTTAQYMRDLLTNGMATECCMISASKNEYALNDSNVEMIKQRLLDMIQRVPCPLSRLTDVFKHRLLVTAMSMDPSHPVDVAVKVPYLLQQATVDNKPTILLLTMQYSYDSPSRHTAIALPINANIKEGPVAVPSSIFEFEGLSSVDTWPGVELTEGKRSRLRKIAQNVVSEVHLTHADPVHVRWALVELSKMHDIPILFRQDGDLEFATVTGFDKGIANLDEATGLISPTPAASTIAPFLSVIETSPGTNAGHLVMQCMKARFLHTKDLLIAWADGANASDMQRLHGDEVMQTFCQCSTEQATREYHSCAACGALSVCKGLTMTRVATIEVLLCARCVLPHLPHAPIGVRRPVGPRGRPAGGTSGTEKTGSRKPTGVASRPEKTRVRSNIDVRILGEYDKVFPDRDGLPSEREEARAALLACYHSDAEGQFAGWTDAYLGSLIVAREGHLACSVEAAQPLIWKNGKPRAHVSENMLLTKHYANCLAMSNGSIALQVLHKLDAATNKTERADYIRRLDHLYLIRSQIPWDESKRLAVERDETFQAQFAEQWRTGVADMSACEKIADQDTLSSPYLWRLRMNTRTWLNRKTDSLHQITSVQKFVKDLEQSTGRIFRRLGEDVPYPFDGGPDPTDWSWSMLYGVAEYSYRIVVRHCNSRGTTTLDIPRLLCAMLYLLANNDCPNATPLLRLPVTMYTRHSLTLSVGKGRHDLDMDAGFPMDVPISLETFDPESCNLCVEPWCCNAAKGNRDDETDAIREDFRRNLRQHNPPYWDQDLAPLNVDVTAKYIQSAPLNMGGADDDDDDDHFTPPSNNEIWEPVLEKRNMKNLGQTCYLSTLMQTLHNNEDFRHLVADDTKFKFKDDTGASDVSFLPSGEVVRELSRKEIVAYRQQKLTNIRLLIYKIQTLFGFLDLGGRQLSAGETQKLLNRIAPLESRWQNYSEEPAQLLDLLIGFLDTACDSSLATGNGQTIEMSNHQESENKQGRRLFDLGVDATSYWRAFCGEGHESDVTNMFFSQVVKESPCGQEDCEVVSRGFNHLFIEYLDFPRNATVGEAFDLDELLDLWKHEILEVDSPHVCEHIREHPVSLNAYRRFTRLARNICFAFRRGPLSEGAVEYPYPVGLPDILDLAPYADTQGLPSKKDAPAVQMMTAMEYELVAVSNWKSGHYIGYALASVEGEKKWVMFNDLQPAPVAKHPSEGHADVRHSAST
jgi:ubiquitin C-terminal hydrolase